MINKKNSGRWAKVKSLCFIPTACLAICLASCAGNTNNNAKDDSGTPDTTAVENSKPETRAATVDSTASDVVEKCEVMPEFPGGDEGMMKFLTENVKYPKEAIDNGTGGKVLVEFIVECDGSLSDVKVQKSVAPALDNEAVRVVKAMPKWKPGTNGGKTVRVKHTLPVTFKLV